MALKLKFTKQALADLVCPADKSDMLVYDTETKGLALRVTKAGGKSFYVVRKIRGKDHRTNLGPFDPASTKLPAIREAAVSAYAKFSSEEERKRSLSLRESITIDMAFEAMLAEKNTLAKRTVEDYRRTYTNYIKKHLADRPLASISKNDVLRLHAETTLPVMRPSGKMTPPRNRSANKAASLLGCIFSFSIAHYEDEKNNHSRIFSYNPVDYMTTIKKWHDNKRDKLRINPDELSVVINMTLDLSTTPPLRDVPTSFQTVSAAVLFMLFSGVRPGEVPKIKKSYVCHKTRSIIFPKRTLENEADTLKNGEEFHLVLNDTAYCQLVHASKFSLSDYVFSGVDLAKISESNVRDFLGKISPAINKHLPRKILRATFISIAERCGVGAFYIKVLCNHSGKGQTVDVTDGYKTAYLSEIREASAKVEAEIHRCAKINKEYVCRGLLPALQELEMRELKNKGISL